jgi:hypothetical protein
MGRVYVDCREMPSENDCSVAISADDRDELLDIAVLHVVAAHGHENTPALREQIAAGIHEGAPA